MAIRLPDGEEPVSSVRAGFVPHGRADKYRAIIRAARTVFGREGYPRTTIDAIAAEAGVSSRTIYNHFEGKEQLFSAVLYASAEQVAEGFSAKIAKIADSPLAVTDPVHDLNVLGHAFATLRLDFPEHFAMVDQIIAEAQHFPPEMIDAWQDAGPRRVQREIARRLQRLTRDGLLRIGSPSRATIHFMALTTAGMTTGRYGSAPLSGEQLTENVQAGVDAFLNGYGTGARSAAPDRGNPTADRGLPDLTRPGLRPGPVPARTPHCWGRRAAARNRARGSGPG
jgi:AcrR family transcriptional regulator